MAAYLFCSFFSAFSSHTLLNTRFSSLRYIVVSFLLLLSVLAGSGVRAQVTEVVGTTSGSLGVSPNGAATYSIPIAVPIGTTGVQPKIALQYNSRAGNGLLGMGWSVLGQSTITRCGTDNYFDNPNRETLPGIGVDPVDYDDNDKFCMNGQRIVSINGTYGADGTEYRTAFEEFSKIVSSGNIGGSPASFTVYKKSGEIFTYGTSTDSRIIGQNQTKIRTWALKRIADVKGNYIEFSYHNDQATGEFYLTRIDYTGNDTVSPALSPFNHIEFVYETRPDPIKAYMSGDLVQITKRLTNVKVYAEGTLFHDYKIAYGSGSTNRSRITSITECAGTNGTTCFKPTVFNWSLNGVADFTKTEYSVADSIPEYYKVVVSGDFNGDGLTDFLLSNWRSDGRAASPATYPNQVWLAQSNGTFNKITYASADSIKLYHNVVAVGDFNGDGLTDFYTSHWSSSGWAAPPTTSDPNQVWISNGDGTFNRTDLSPSDSMQQYYNVVASGDFNGDGRTDLYLSNWRTDGRAADPTSYPNQIWLAKPYDSANEPAFFTKQTVGTADGLQLYDRVVASGDFNGDGLTDLYVAHWTSDGWAANPSSIPNKIFLAKGDGTFQKQDITSQESIPQYYNVAATGDFNGDGLTDFLLSNWRSDGRAADPSTYPNQIWLGKGDGSFNKTSLSATDSLQLYYTVATTGDFNGDGLTDIYVSNWRDDGRAASPANNPNEIWLATGSGGFSKVSLTSAQSLQTYHTIAASGDFNGDGLSDVLSVHWSSNGWAGPPSASHPTKKLLSAWSVPDQITKITNGHGLVSEVIYKPMTDASVYTKGSGAVYPVQDTASSIQLVAEVKADNGIGGQNSQAYTYEALRTQVNGFGSLGFEKMRVTDGVTGIVSESVYLQDWTQHHHGLLSVSRTILPDNTVTSEENVTWQVQGQITPEGAFLCFRYSSASTAVSRDINGSFISRVIKSTAYDVYGFPTQITVRTENEANTESHEKVTNNTYTHDAANWILGRLTTASVTHKSQGLPDQIRTSGFTYNTEGLLTSETMEPGNALSYTKTYAHNNFGAVTNVTETWGSTATDGIVETERTTSYEYDAKSRYRTKETNPLGHEQTTLYHAVHGLPVSTTGPNGLTTTVEYDDFGRKTKVTNLPGTAAETFTDTFLEACGGAVTCPSGGIFQTRVVSSGGAESISYIDKLNRAFRKKTKLDSQWSVVDTQYDAQGRVTQTSEPYFEGASTQHWTTVQYDLIGRPVLTIRPDQSEQSVSYDGLIQIGTNELAQKKTVTKDILGRTKTVKDDANQVITYSYDALGLVTSMTGGGITQSYAYNIRGNKVSDTDPDKGTWSYVYNALGLVVAQTNAKGEVTAMTYDVLGRMLTRIDDANAANPETRTAQWFYDSTPNAVGKLYRAVNAGYDSIVSYDGFSRPVYTKETIDGEDYYSVTAYDGQSRPEKITYPSGLAVWNVYDAQGALKEVVNDNSGTIGTLKYWQRLEVDARGNITKAKLGNGVETLRSYTPETGRLSSIYSYKGVSQIQDSSYQFDVLGNLTQRTNNTLSQTENFAYDNLNRVVQVDTIVGGNTTTVTTAYSATGNITSKSDVGTYTYGQVHTGCASGFAGPHAVTTVSGTKNATYCYDANGNMTSGDGRTVTYSAFDKPVYITKSTSAVQFAYSPDRKRYKRVDTSVANGTSTTLYIGGKSYEKTTKSATNDTILKHYVGDFAVITHVYNNGTPVSAQTGYLHRDHLGSVEAITDENGTILQQMSFDAWGKRRETNWQAFTEAAITSFDTTHTTRGFTGHEQLDTVALIHMNGRVYDPELGRFLSADPNVQAVDNLQNWNRYSYVLNNPLSYTDPTGFFFKSIFRAIGKVFKSAFKPFKQAVKKALRNQYIRSAVQIAGCYFGGAPGCAATAAAVTYATGGSIGDAAKAAAFAYASYLVWSEVASFTGGKNLFYKTAVHSVVGGALSVAQGGSFREGFIANGIGALAGGYSDTISQGDIALDTAIVAVAGGVASELTGGKFENGAFTAAMANLYNKFGESSKDAPNNISEINSLNYTETYSPYDPNVDAIKSVYPELILLPFSKVLRIAKSTFTLGKNAYKFIREGKEFPYKGKNWRIALFGNRTSHPTGKFPHYHRVRRDPKTGQTKPGQSMKRHRPWDKKPTDKSFLDRF